MKPEPPHHLDDLRQQLRSLGYLDAGVDRFVLGAARGTRGPFAIAALASTRIGVLAALLLGPATAIGVATRASGLITGAGDAFVVAGYFAVFFAVAVSGVAFAVNLIVDWLAGRRTTAARPRALAISAGAVMTVACLGYLTLWWDASSFAAPSSGSAYLWTGFALAVAAAISLLLGHTVTVAALAVIVAKTGTAGTAAGVPGTSRRVMTAAGVVAFCGALLLFRLTTGFDRRGADVPALTVVSTGLRVRLIAIDGFDPDVARRLSAAGRLPSLSAAFNDATATVAADGFRQGSGESTEAPGAKADDTQDPARFWTTVATGQPPEVHAVHGLETRRVAGLQGALPASSRAIGAATDLIRLTRPGIVSGSERRVKTVWEVAASAGLRTAVVNWWATWPAPADTGIIVTDRAPVRLERGGSLDAEIAPAETYEVLRARWDVLRQEASARASQLSAAPALEGIMRRSAELDALQLAIARAVGSPDHDLACTYLPGLDVVQHALLNVSDGTALAPSALTGRLAALERYYEFLDGLVGASLQPAPGELILMLTSRGRVETPTTGLLIARGTITSARVRDAAARPVDVMPTILYALGVPISQELRGRAIVELFSPDFARRYPVRTVSTYGRPYTKPSPRSGQPLDQEMIDRLRSLGYVR